MNKQAVIEETGNRELEIAVGSLANRIAYWTDDCERLATPIPGLLLFRRSEQTEPLSVMYEPSICLLAQGAKRILLGDDALVYDPGHYLLTSVHLPTIAQVIEATPSQPCLGLRMTLDLRQVSRLMADSNLPVLSLQRPGRGMAVGVLSSPLVEAFNRLIDLLTNVQDIPILAPVIQREIVYRILVGDQATRLRQIASAGSRTSQLARAIEWLQDNYKEPVRIDDLASRVGMSTSTFHNHFRNMTAQSPLQYQKQLRLQEARRLMLVNNLDASDAAYQVGYESPSQFSREYSRQFGAPPLRDINSLRQTSLEENA